MESTMKNNTMIKEVFLLRSIACLSIVLLHAIEIGIESIKYEIGSFTYLVFDSIHVFLYYGTPMFIFISELLIAYSYRKKNIPKDFLRKRFTFIFIPFLCMALFYSIPYASTFQDWVLKFFLNAFIGDFHGYFVLIIFQFYLLHLFFHHYLQRVKPRVIITISFLLNAGYLAFFNMTEPYNILYSEYIWERFYWIPFFGWIFYFSLGYYCGLYYERFISGLKKHKAAVTALPIVSSTFLLYVYHSELITVHSSKRIDMMLHTAAIGFFILYVTSYMKKIPNFLIFISQYSFGIYLLHFFYLLLFDAIYNIYPGFLGISYVFLLFFGSTTCSIITIYHLNNWKYGKYIVGKIGAGYKNKANTSYTVAYKQKPLQS